jgi:adenine-specific DNA-methyltransferase
MPTLDWIGKSAVLNHHRQVPYHLLRCDRELSAGDPDAGNLLVQGDNLLALKALLPYYAGKVKCIYIDPPYNTGNENWVYNDNVNSPEIRQWITATVGREGEDLSRHDKWLCMMYPRLALLRDFLTEDGAIFVSIDDNEVHLLRCLMDELFGPRNFVATVLWQKKYASSNDHTGIAPMHDFILVYQRSSRFQRNLIPRTAEKDRQYRFQDERGIFRLSDYTCNKTADERPNLYYSVVQPNTKKEVWPKRTRVWAYSREVFAQHERDGLTYWGQDGLAETPSFKRYRHLLRRGEGIVPNTWWTHDIAGHTDEAKKEIRALDIGDGAFDFVTPKPTRLIEMVMRVGAGKDSLILDAFAGSGTTGHAVLSLNKVDGGSRRFIMVEMDERIARDVTAQRIRKAIEGYGDTPGLGGGFRFCKLGTALFDEAGNIGGEVRFPDLAAHVFFTETGSPIPARASGKTPLLGVHQGKAVYLLFNGVLGDKRPGGGNVLTHTIAQDLPAHPAGNGPRVVYGEACRLGSKSLDHYGITFRQIPFELKVD